MKQEFSFTEASALIQTIEKNKSRLIDREISHYYRDIETDSSDSPAVFIVGDIAIIVFWFLQSCMNVAIADKESFFADTSLNFLFKDIPESRNLQYPLHCCDSVDFVGKKIESIDVECFSKAHETCEIPGGERPDGGDYFSSITVKLTDGSSFYFYGEEAEADGYMSVCHGTPPVKDSRSHTSVSISSQADS